MARLDAAAGPGYSNARGAESGHTPLSITAWPQQRLIWIGAGVLALALIVLGALVIVSSSRGPDAPKDTAQLPVIHAEEKPFKVRPENPGGMDIPHQDKLIYKRLRGEERPIKVERLLSEPEKPLPPPEPAPPPEAVSPGAAPVEAGETDPAAVDAIERSIVERGLIAPPNGEADAGGEEEGMLPDEAAASDASATAAIPVPRPRPSTRSGETAALAPPTAPSAPAATAPAAPPAAAASGSFRIQLGAYASAEKVDAEWRRLQAQHPGLLGALKPESSRVEVPDRGTLYRLRAGPIEGEDRARALCQDLVRRGAGCLVVQPRG
jgi:cell division septation protein DedD